jgi:hypothetical protein
MEKLLDLLAGLEARLHPVMQQQMLVVSPLLGMWVELAVETKAELAAEKVKAVRELHQQPVLAKSSLALRTLPSEK